MVERQKTTVYEDVSAKIRDWDREKVQRFWDPSRKLLLAIRRYQYWRDREGVVPACFRKCVVMRYRFWSVITGAEIPLNCNIGGGVPIFCPAGCVINYDTKN